MPINIAAGLPGNENKSNISLNDYTELMKSGIISPEVYKQIVGESGGVGSSLETPDFSSHYIAPKSPKDERDSMGNYYNVRGNTHSLDKATGNPIGGMLTTQDSGVIMMAEGGSVPNADRFAQAVADATAPQVKGSLTPWGTVADVAQNAAGGGEYSQDFRSESADINPEYKPAFDKAVEGMYKKGAEAQQGIGEAAKIQKEMVTPVAEEAGKIARGNLADTSEAQGYIANDMRLSLQSMENSKNQMQQAVDLSKTNVTEETLAKMKLDHPIMSAIAFTLGGFSAGMGGANPAMDMLNLRVKGAINQQNHELDSLYKQSENSRILGQNYLSNAEKTAAINSIVSTTVLMNTSKMVDYVATQAQSAAAVELAKQAKFGIEQQILKSAEPVIQLTKQFYAEGQAKKVKNLAAMMYLYSHPEERNVGKRPLSGLGGEYTSDSQQPSQPTPSMLPAPSAPTEVPSTIKDTKKLIESTQKSQPSLGGMLLRKLAGIE